MNRKNIVSLVLLTLLAACGGDAPARSASAARSCKPAKARSDERAADTAPEEPSTP